MRVKISDVFKMYGITRALNGVDIDLDKDISALSLIGPSGGGKSTLLRILGGLEIPDHGVVCINNKEVNYKSEESLLDHRRRNGYLFQSFNLFPHKTALENVTLPLELVHGLSSSVAIETANHCLDRFELIEHAHKLPFELSGGQQQRVAIARAIAPGPSLLFLDEPTSALDPEMTGEVLDLIAELKEGGQDIILTTHEMGFAREIADELIFLDEGKILETGEPKLLFSKGEKNSRLEKFLSRVMRY
ncbi:MAG TPA: amino acid ABC transporter ATP-binding protein [Verrucomicrobia bacterium]|nr:amino acid ABC transporter ATP-binding protein [Verrucomicrobiales bacterium]HIL56106.1 amino acid ABC transporter ATP-binding protein [Verrucomicrobiota bacterium]